MKCYYCGQLGVETDCLDNLCCVDCWGDMKDWTLEDQARLDKLSKEVSRKMKISHAEILQENGLPADFRGILCHVCRKPVQSREKDGSLHCDCTDERRGTNNPHVVPIPSRFLMKE